MTDFGKYIRSVPDFPKPGVKFYDITTLLTSPEGYKLALDAMEKYVRSRSAHRILAVEARGFVFGAALADRLGMSLALVRKPGKLPYTTIGEDYDLEYGTDSLEVHLDCVKAGDNVVIVDDLIATGGTLKAVCTLVERLGGGVVGISSVIELSFLPWRDKLDGYDVDYLISFDSE